MRFGIGQLILVFLLIFLLFGNFSKIKIFFDKIIGWVKEIINRFLNK